MNGPLPSWQELNAYVDGEMSAADAARIARALVHDRALARRVATLSRLKAAVEEDAAGIAMAAVRLPARRRRQTAFAAACAAILLVIAVVGVAPWGDPGRAPDQPAWQAALWTAHRAWTADAAASPREGAGVMLAGLDRLGPDAQLPDLSAAGLEVARVAPFRDSAAEPGLHAGYVGSRGCRLSLFLLPAPEGMATALSTYRSDDDRAYGWRVNEVAYVLIASGMEAARFDLIARSVERASRQRALVDADTRTALRDSREASPPCAA